MSPMTGRVIGSYRVIAKVGEGGMGTVYRAVDTMVEREVALKSLRPELVSQPGIVERFRSEAVLLARLNHPAIAQLYTFIKEGDVFYMVMEYVAGYTLQDVIQRFGSIPLTRALTYTSQILQGVGHAHALGILHRDLKPGNIMLTPAEKVKIMDFGIARALGTAGMTRDGRVIGTLEYLAPERIRGKQDDPRSDLYSVGVVLYQMLTGRVPFSADSDYDLLTAQVEKQPPRPHDIGVDLPEDIEGLLMTALQKDPEKRFPDAAAFEAAVMAATAFSRGAALKSKDSRVAATGADVGVLDPAPTRAATSAAPVAAGGNVPREKTSPARNKLVAAVAIAAGVLLLAGVGFLVVHKRAKTPPAVQANLALVVTPVPEAAPPPPEPSEPDMVVTPSSSDAAVGALAATARSKNGGTAKKGQPDSGKAKAPELPPAAVSPAGALTPELRRAALAALDQTDGPAEGEPGARPIQMAGLVAALKMGGSAIEGDIEEAIGRRGVSFQMTPAHSDALRTAGASEPLLKVVEANYYARGAVTPKPAARPAENPQPAPPPPKPVQRITRLRDSKSVFVDCSQDEMRNAVREEIKKQLNGRLQLLDAAAGSDIVMRLTVSGPNGEAITGPMGHKDHAQVRATVVDAATGNALWEQSADDRKVLGLFQGDTLKRLASRIVKDLKEALTKK